MRLSRTYRKFRLSLVLIARYFLITLYIRTIKLLQSLPRDLIFYLLDQLVSLHTDCYPCFSGNTS